MIGEDFPTTAQELDPQKYWGELYPLLVDLMGQAKTAKERLTKTKIVRSREYSDINTTVTVSEFPIRSQSWVSVQLDFTDFTEIIAARRITVTNSRLLTGKNTRYRQLHLTFRPDTFVATAVDEHDLSVDVELDPSPSALETFENLVRRTVFG